MANQEHTITRRVAVGGSLAAGVIAMTVATKGEVVDPVVSLGREYFDHKRRYDDIERAHGAGVVGTEAFERMADEILELIWKAYDRLSTMQATSLEGLAMQARVLQAEAPHILLSDGGPETTLLANMVAALEKMGA